MENNSEKNRFYFGLITILVVVASSILLLWQKSNFQKTIAQINLSQDVIINNLQKDNQDLRDQLAKNNQSGQGQVAGATATTSGKSTSSILAKININTADTGELDKLPGIGATRAQQIIDYRNSNGPFQKPEDIMKVSGIGQATYDKMKEMITVK